MSRALEGIRVLDLADRSAALGGRILADLGAEVILVEPPGGLSIRALAPFLDDEPGSERSFHHQNLSANKKSVILEAGLSPTPSEAFAGLIQSADVLLETARPGTRAGLDHATLRDLNPGLIQVSVTPFGLGDERGRRANDLVAGAASGLVQVSGERLGTPVQGGAHPSYCMAGLAAASATTIALTQRDARADGAGCHIDISLQEATAMAVTQTATPTEWTWRERIPKRPGLSSAIRCADGGHVGLLVRPDRFPKLLEWCERVGIEHGMSDEDWVWCRLDAPRKNNPVSAAILALAARLSRDEFADGALEADMVCLPVLDFNDIAHHEQFLVNDQFREVEQAALGRKLGFVRSPVDGMADGVEIRPAPALGEHTKEILDEALARAGTRRRSESANSETEASAHTNRHPTQPGPDPTRALEGVRVVDFGWVLAAPIGTRILASFGAEVIRIESRRKPDSMRSQVGPDGRPDPDLGGLFNSVNAGKKSLGVDLTKPEGLALVKELIATADIVVNNFRPGALARMGLGYDVLCALKPDIILLSLPGAHPKGPWARRASMGNILMSASGFNMLTGFEGDPPRGIGVAYPDFVSPHLLVSSVLAALRHRRLHGEGQEIQAAQLSATLSLLGVEWMQFKATGVQPARKANRCPSHCPHGVYPAAGEDQWVAFAVRGEAGWAAFCDEVGRPELVKDRRFSAHALRKANEDELDEILREWTSTCDKWECADRLQRRGIAAAAVQDLRDNLERDPLLKTRFQNVRQPVAPDVDIPINLEVARWVGSDHVLRRAPAHGEHNEEIVRDLLGRSDAAYTDLVLRDVLD